MITIDNFKETLRAMGFSEDIYSSIFTKGSMCVDFTSQRLVYPSEVRGREHNTSFTAPENFVVFECVNRLIEKGYRPQDIELEKSWQLGKLPKSGRADICVYARDSQEVLLIIECKTCGREFDKAKADTLTDGAQLFSYWQQENSAKWLVLYTSDLKDGIIKYKSPSVCCTDDPNVALQSKTDKSIKLYKNANSNADKFAVWYETYNLELQEDVVFSANSQAYSVGLQPLRKRDLVPFDGEDGIVNKFEEILRHNNVSDKENAFNRLIALFICKLVDELTKDENAEVDFQYRPRADSYETLQDRLQRLFTHGMAQFMQEEITYIPENYPDDLFASYDGRKRRQAIEDLKAVFRKLKYFTNNDFAFKDVHNEKLFYQNGKVLVEVVQLFQRYRIVETSQQQFLGDLFEQLLDKGFKQNEGQFFTPLPITRFIWDCLPLKRYVSQPRVIDYACGAGHFLIEAVEAINHFIPSETNYWVRDCIFGIEKDYRLARVSKVSMFMNGAGESNIVFGDGLENCEQIRPGTFDILTANPPYSVASFKQHLNIKDNEFALLDAIEPSGSEIEVLFVERMGQLLRGGGIAAVILPSSILSNASESYTGARKELLSKFKVRAIVRLGNKTFKETGTNTVIMFLERYAYPPERSVSVKDSRDAILDGHVSEDWEDKEILESYLEYQGLSADEWLGFVHQTFDVKNMPEYFRKYLDAFTARKENEKKNPEEFRRKLWEYMRKIEGEKLLYYGLTYRQRTVVILAPLDNAGQKEFLGYDWSSKKGHEGIQYVEPRGGKMYVNADREAEGTLAHTVRQSFGDGEVVIGGEAGRYARVVRLSDMLDFSRAGFTASMNLNPERNVSLESKYPSVEIGKLLTLEYGKGLPASQRVDGEYPVLGSNGRIGTHNTFWVKGPVIILGRTGSAGAVTWEDENCYPIDTTYHVQLHSDKVLLRYVFYIFQHMDFSVLNNKMGVPCINREDVYKLTIPLPPMDIQQAIASECHVVDSQEASLNAKISSCRERIEALFRELEALPPALNFTLEDKRAFTLAIGKRVLNSEVIPDGQIPVFSANVFEPFGYVNEFLRGVEDFTSASILWGIDGDFMVNFVKKDTPFYPTDHCGVLRVLTDKVHPRYLARILEREGRRLGFSRSYRASLDRIGGITIAVPDIDAQIGAMNEVLSLEERITQANSELVGLSGIKAAILKKYVN